MHTNRISLARKFLFWLGAALGLALLSGCDSVVLTNLTPPSLPENPSQIYTITLRVTKKNKHIEQGSIKPQIVIDGENHAMTKSDIGEGIYEYDYHLPPGRDEIAYYFLVNYSFDSTTNAYPVETYTGVSHAKIVRRYVLSLEVNRGPVGARISVLGRGFTPQDVVYFDNSPARTVFESSSALSFFVPALAAGRTITSCSAAPRATRPSARSASTRARSPSRRPRSRSAPASVSRSRSPSPTPRPQAACCSTSRPMCPRA